MTQLNRVMKSVTVILVLILTFNFCNGQNILNKNISLQVNKQRLDNVLEILSNKGNFYFSYNSNILKRDSLVTFTVYNKTVRQVLDFLFDSEYEYKESGNYVIIRRTPIKMSLISNKVITEDKIYTVTGYVLDDESGEKLSDASIYEKRLLVSALTNQNGFFKIKLKSKNKTAELTVSKEFYEDTTVIIQPRYNQQLTITIQPLHTNESIVTISPQDYYTPDSIKLTVETDSAIAQYMYVKKDSIKVERTAFGKFLISSKQKLQSLNLKKFFVEKPFQVSFTPGLSTHGKLNSQIVNNFSLNILGGYSGGLNGVEIGGLFNINKKDAQYFQTAGLFNLTGSNVKGVQFAGINNTVLGNFSGWQTAGINNFVKGKVRGWQLAGIHNHSSDSVQGVQLAGIANFANKKMDGLQISGIGNFSRQAMRGLQISGIFNYAKKMQGVQIGLINISDTSYGYSIGLLNLVNKGYHKISLYANEVMNTNVTLKTGNAKLYSMLIGAVNLRSSEKIYSFGFGLGHDFILSKLISISTELSSQYLYRGSWYYTNLLNKFSPSLNFHLNKYISLFAGPVLNIYYSDQASNLNGYKDNIPSSHYHTFEFNSKVNGWIGWNTGITLF